MLRNKQRLYWTLQLGGWTLYGVVQIAASVIASASGSISLQRILFLAYEAFFCLIISHGYRHFINRWRWLSLGMPLLIPRVLLSSMVLGLLMYFFRIPVSIPLGLFNQEKVLDVFNLVGQSFYYIFPLVSILFYLQLFPTIQ
jgi:two-component system, LytTR family, sensor kinase